MSYSQCVNTFFTVHACSVYLEKVKKLGHHHLINVKKNNTNITVALHLNAKNEDTQLNAMAFKDCIKKRKLV